MRCAPRRQPSQRQGVATMKTIVMLLSAASAIALSACGKSDLEKQAEKDTAISKQMAGDVNKVPRVNVPPDSQEKKKEGGK